MKKILIATKNTGKLAEFQNLLKDFNLEIISLNDINLEEPEEDGNTFEENSTLKAKYYGEKVSCSSLADDSGLCIVGLNNFPSIYSARYAKESGGYPLVFDCLKKKMESEKIIDYSAFFICNLSFFDIESNKIFNFEGRIDGKIDFSAKGKSGFGYDPIFVPNGFSKTFAEMTMDEKNSISHRFLALDKFKNFLEKHYGK